MLFLVFLFELLLDYSITHDFPIENQESGFDSRDTNDNTLYHAPV